MTDSITPALELRAAATLLLARDTLRGPELLLVKRHARSAFMPNLYVYPGGALDAADCDPALSHHVYGCDNPQQLAARLGEPETPALAVGLLIAAVRETFEEAGLLLARHRTSGAPLDPTRHPELARRLHVYRAELNAGNIGLLSVLEAEGLVLELGALVPLARWVTPPGERRRFDARFFVARAPLHQLAMHDNAEVVDHQWMTPADILSRYQAAELSLSPPTLLTLATAARATSVDALLEDARGATIAPILPHVLPGESHTTITFPGDPAHPEPHASLGLCWTRLVLRDGIWRGE